MCLSSIAQLGSSLQTVNDCGWTFGAEPTKTEDAMFEGQDKGIV